MQCFVTGLCFFSKLFSFAAGIMLRPVFVARKLLCNFEQSGALKPIIIPIDTFRKQFSGTCTGQEKFKGGVWDVLGELSASMNAVCTSIEI